MSIENVVCAEPARVRMVVTGLCLTLDLISKRLSPEAKRKSLLATGQGRGLLGGESLSPCTAPAGSTDGPCGRCLMLTGKVPVLGDTGLGPRPFGFPNLTI